MALSEKVTKAIVAYGAAEAARGQIKEMQQRERGRDDLGHSTRSVNAARAALIGAIGMEVKNGETIRALRDLVGWLDPNRYPRSLLQLTQEAADSLDRAREIVGRS